jgi:hypothetical protein
MKVLLAAVGIAAVMISTTMGVDAQGSKGGATCAARCKAYCNKNYPGYPNCNDKCMTRQCR